MAFRYRVDEAWDKFPANGPAGEAVGVACDSKNRVYVLLRGPRPVLVFEANGTPVGGWGEGQFVRPHGIFIDRQDQVYCTDDFDHTVRVFTTSGELKLTLGKAGKPSDTGATSIDYRTITHGGPPFNFPTNVALGPTGDIFVSDGYGNARIHRFAPDGRLLLSWGSPGSGAGQFHVPHGIAVDKAGTVYVADRENSRIQLFSSEGECTGEWRNVARPCQVFIWDDNFFVAELGHRAGRWPGTGEAQPGDTGGRVSVFDKHGMEQASWGGGENPTAAGDFYAPHDIWVDGRGDVYVAEVAWSAGGKAGRVAPTCHTLQSSFGLESMNIQHDRLRDLVAGIFAAAGCDKAEAERIALRLVEANLVGHDSHGVIRVASYVQWLKTGKVFAGKSLQVVSENEAIAVVDGQYGFGQTIGEQAMRLGIDKCRRHGVAVVALRNSGHLGRIGDWPLLAAEAGLLSLHFVNTTGAGILVAPFGGINRRLSANPIAAGVPMGDKPPILLDISACTLAEGKIRVALNKGVPVPENCILDAQGRPTTDPKVFYANPPGAILPIAGHKGYGLAILCEVLAGALTGGGCSDPAKADRVVNGMLSIFLDPGSFRADAEFQGELERFVGWVKSSEKVTVDGEILMPGEIEERTKAKRLRDGIEIDATTWAQLTDAAKSVGK